MNNPFSTSAALLEARLRQRLDPGAHGTGFGTHFRVRIAAPQFVGKSRVAQHRLVYDALQEFIDQGLHALAIELL